MSETSLSLAIEDSIAFVTLNRPEKRNALDHQQFLNLHKTFHELDTNKDVRAVVLSGKGKSFCAGLDLTSLTGLSIDMGNQTARNRMELLKDVKIWQDALTAIETCRKPVIAAIHGACVGGGLDIVAACDMRLASNDAFFSLREAAMAIAADLGVLQRLPLIIGQGYTREMAFTAGDYTAEQAKNMNLVNSIHPDPESTFAAAKELAAKVAEQSPLAVQSTKDILNVSREMSIEHGLQYSVMKNAMILPSGELVEAFQAFMEKRKPKF